MFAFIATFVVILLCTHGWQRVTCQANVDNPFIWQIIASYNTTQPKAHLSYDTTTSVKVYSQDFQTVVAKDEYFGRNEHLLVDFGDACPGTTLDDISARNGNASIAHLMMSQPVVALVARGGHCGQWSEKLNVMQTLADDSRLGVSAVLIYDNNTYNTTQLLCESTMNASYPVWNSTLPLSRNVRHMSDNDLDKNSTVVGVYFAPLEYGLELLQDLSNILNNTDSVQRSIQLTMFSSETSFKTGPGSDYGEDDSNKNKNNDVDGDNIWNLFTSNRTYVAYLVAAVAVLFLILVLFRWYLKRRTSVLSQHQPRVIEDGVIMHALGAYPVSESRCVITLDQLNIFSSAEEYKDDSDMKNGTCAICLEDFKPTNVVRVLPCHHGFCAGCIDAWLTKMSSVCPICKYDCTEKTTKISAVHSSSPPPPSDPAITANTPTSNATFSSVTSPVNNLL